MNFKAVIRVYGLLRGLTDDESALLVMLRAMTDTDRELLVQFLAPAKPAGKKATRKAATTRIYDHCLRCGTTKRDSSHKDEASPDYHQFQSSVEAKPKSARAVSLAEQIKGAGKLPRPAQSLCTKCDYDNDHNIHHLESVVGYHPFTPPVRGADEQSSASSGAGSTTRNSADATVNAQSAAGGSSD